MNWQAIRNWYRPRGDAWFVPKLFGLGATPVTWQGWAMVLGFAAVEALIVIRLPGPDWMRLVLALLALVPFVMAVWTKTDGSWRFRWGPDSKD